MILLLVGGVALILVLAAYLVGYAHGNKDGWDDASRENQRRDSALAAAHKILDESSPPFPGRGKAPHQAADLAAALVEDES